jgi:tetratricopeptide (TPR) repeat protein
LLARAHYQLGSAQRMVQDFESGDRSLQQALELAEVAADDETAARAWMRLMTSATRKSNTAKARELQVHARAKVKRLGDPAELLAFYYAHSENLSRIKRDYTRAREEGEAALKLYEPLGIDRPRVVEVLTSLAGTCDALGERDEARRYAERALQIAERLYGPRNPQISRVLKELAWSHLRSGDMQGAIRRATRGLENLDLSESPRTLDRVGLLTVLAAAHTSLGQGREALAAMLEGLRIREEVFGSESPRLISPLINLARVLMLQDPAMAEVHLQRALSLARSTQNASSSASALYHLGLIYQHRDKFEEALENFEEALRLYRGHFDDHHPKVAMVATDLAETHLKLERPLQALRALDLPEPKGRSPRDAAHTKFVKAKALWLTGKRRNARVLAEEAYSVLKDDSGATEWAEEILAWLSKFN